MRFASTLFVMLIIFLFSVYLRMALVNNTISNYDHCDFFLLTTFENWEERGIADCHFSPILTYNNLGDKHVAYYKRLESKEGDNYFVSFPPFAFLFPYGIFKLLHIVPGKLAIQVLNMLLHFVGAFFIYMILFRHFNKSTSLKLHFPSLVAFTVYLFIPILLYTHAVVYFPETLGQVLWVVAIYLTTRWVDAGAEAKRKSAYLLGIAIFFMIYTEWIGILYVVVLLIVLQRNKAYEPSDKIFLIKSVLVSFMLSITLTLVQYSSIDGFWALAKAFAIRYAERSGLMDAVHSDMGFNFFSSESYLKFAINLNAVLYPFGYLLILLTAIVVFKSGFAYLLQVIKRNKILFSLATFPGIIHLFVFFNSSVIHRHCVAVLGISIAVFSGLISAWFINRMGAGSKIIIIQIAIICIAVILSRLNLDSSHPAHSDHSFLSTAAKVIKQDSKKDEVVFLNMKTEFPNPLHYISFMSKRNMLYANDSVDAKNKLGLLQKSKGVFYQFNEISEVPVVYRFSFQ